MSSNKAVVLLSGGLDSATTLAVALRDNDKVFTLSFNYKQVNTLELDLAHKIAQASHVEKHQVLDLPLDKICKSALTGASPIPKKRKESEILNGIPSTYVPARNIIFLSLAWGYAESLDASHIYIGVNALDYSGYPDCRPEFIEAYQQMALSGTKDGSKINILTPLIHLSKAEIIQLGESLNVDFAATSSCYQSHPACGSCDSCLLRKKGFLEANVPDPTLYEEI